MKLLSPFIEEENASIYSTGEEEEMSEGVGRSISVSVSRRGVGNYCILIHPLTPTQRLSLELL
jgi:hypothetical protein